MATKTKKRHRHVEVSEGSINAVSAEMISKGLDIGEFTEEMARVFPNERIGKNLVVAHTYYNWHRTRMEKGLVTIEYHGDRVRYVKLKEGDARFGKNQLQDGVEYLWF